MKKCILLFLSFCFIFIFSLNTNASILPDWTSQKNIRTLDISGDINIMKPCPDNLMPNTNFYNTLTSIIADTEISKGGLKYSCTVWDRKTGNYRLYINVVMSVEDYMLSNIKATIEDDVIYDCNFTDGDNPKSTISKEIDLNEYFKTEDKAFWYGATSHLELVDGTEHESNLYNDSDELEVGFMIGALYKKNQKYDSTDLYIVSNFDNPLSKDQILSSITVYDQTEKDISYNARIENNSYNLDDNNRVALGKYEMDIVAQDSAGNITVQHAYVQVCDIVAPQITGNDIEVEYNKKINDISYLYSITDNSGEYIIDSIVDNYSESSREVGNHTITITASDKSNNVSTKIINVNVVDKKAPVLTINKITATTTSPINSVDELYKYISCVDEIDENPTVSIDKDSSDYFAKNKTPGTYSFKVYAKDKYGNKTEGNLEITVEDNDYPEITVNGFVIAVSKGEELTKDQIASVLLQTGQINSLENLKLESAYFKTPNEVGDYDLIISTPEGVCKSVISVKESEESTTKDKQVDTIDYSIPCKTPEKDNSKIYIIFAIIGLIIISSLGVVLYKRKH